ncbi:BREX system ATP-binding domain-containing protein [Desulfocicer vacuolatum]|nr:BREX system ATP-binding domain-containing protein [Desulfocicer vacuolatum]
MNLDPRQVPFHSFQAVYRAVMAGMAFPGGEKSIATVWKKRVEQWLSLPENSHNTCLDLIPRQMPHRFKAILAALSSPNVALSARERKFKKHARLKPREFPWILKNALLGKDIPAWRLSAMFQYRQVSFYKEHSLVCKESFQYLDTVKALAALFRNLGFKGWVILFDEGESICQTRITSRSKSYELLHNIFCPENALGGFYPVFAFTHELNGESGLFTRTKKLFQDQIKQGEKRVLLKNGVDVIPGKKLDIIIALFWDLPEIWCWNGPSGSRCPKRICRSPPTRPGWNVPSSLIWKQISWWIWPID